MTLTQEIADFTAFATTLAKEGAAKSLEDVYQRWRSADESEVELLRARLVDYDAGERGRPAEDVMADLREKLGAKQGS